MDSIYLKNRRIGHYKKGDGRYVVFDPYHILEAENMFVGDMKIFSEHDLGVDVFTIKNSVLHSYNDEPSITKFIRSKTYNGELVKVQHWHTNGVLHRETGCAYMASRKNDGLVIKRMFFLDGESIPIDEFIKKSPISEEEKIILLMNNA